MDLSETRGLVLFRVVRGGIGISQRLGAVGSVSSTGIFILTLEPERLKNRLTTTREDHRRWKGSSPETLKRLAISVFSASKFSPFFQSVSVIAAILRASVSRAMVGFIP